MKNLKISLLLLIMLLGQSLYSQEKYDAGYVVTTTNDTIVGFILSKVDSDLAYSISFKNDLSTENIIAYSTNELLGFGFNTGRVFERKIDKYYSLKDEKNKYIFAKRIVKGKIDLFVWRQKDNKNREFFIVNNSSKNEAQLIKPQKKEVYLEGKNFSQEDKRFKYLVTYVENGESKTLDQTNKLRFSEKSISKEIISYNSKFKEEYPVEKYKEPYKYNYDILVGVPFGLDSDELHFRVGLYRSKTFTDKTNKLSYINGISYQNWSEKTNGWNRDYQYGTSNYSWQMLNLIPIGIKYQTSPKRITPYGYIGVGAAIIYMKDYVIYEYEITGTEDQIVITPTVNVGVGAKIRINSNYILTEITPALNAIFFNIGYSF